MKGAATDASPRTWKVHAAPPPVHGAPNPANRQPAAGAAVSVTFDPPSNGAEHVVGQLMPAGELVTVPLPVGTTLTLNCSLVNVAVTACAVAASVTVHGSVVEAALQPLKAENAAAVAVSVTAVPWSNDAVHVPGQLMPAGE